MKRLILVATLIVGFSAGGQSSAAEPQKWIVAVAPDLRSAVEPLIKRRRQEGMTVTVINVAELPKDAAGAPDAAELQKRIEHEARHGTNRAFVLVVGVAASSGEDAKKVVVPARSGTGGRMKGQPTDHGYGLPDEKMLPSIAVGRMPARSIEEAKTMVEKTLAFERERSGDGWRNRLTVLEGNPGGGNDFERRTAEAVVPSQIQGRFAKLNPEWSARFVVHVDSSPYSVGDSELRAASLDCVRQGQFWTVYLGHSSAPGLWSLDASYLDRKDWSELNAGRHRGLLFTCGCFACQTAGFGGEGYALAAVRNPTGPVAVIGAHCESYAMAGLLALDGLLTELNAAKPPDRLADYWLAVERGLVGGEIDPITFFALDNADGSRGKESLDEQRREHAQMWTLLGDPALRIPPPPLPITLHVSNSVVPGHVLSVSGQMPKELKSAKVRIAIERPLGAPPINEATAGERRGPPSDRRAQLQRANNFELDAQSIEPVNGEFHASLNVPRQLPWPKVVIRATAESDDRSAQGAVAIPVTKSAD